MEQKEPKAITTGSKEYYRPAVKLLSDIFTTDPVIRYMLAPALPKQEDREAYMYEYFCVLLKAAYLNSAVFDEIDDWKACIVRMPPGKRVDNPWTLWSAGFFGSLWKVGLKGGKVSFSSCIVYQIKVLLTMSLYAAYAFRVRTADQRSEGQGLEEG